jgi:hypothetical protein
MQEQLGFFPDENVGKTVIAWLRWWYSLYFDNRSDEFRDCGPKIAIICRNAQTSLLGRTKSSYEAKKVADEIGFVENLRIILDWTFRRFRWF